MTIDEILQQGVDTFERAFMIVSDLEMSAIMGLNSIVKITLNSRKYDDLGIVTIESIEEENKCIEQYAEYIKSILSLREYNIDRVHQQLKFRLDELIFKYYNMMNDNNNEIINNELISLNYIEDEALIERILNKLL